MTTTHPPRPADEGEKCEKSKTNRACISDKYCEPCHDKDCGCDSPAPDADAGGERFNSDGYPSTLTAEERAIVTARVAERTDRENLAVCVAMDFVALTYRERNALIDEAVSMMAQHCTNECVRINAADCYAHYNKDTEGFCICWCHKAIAALNSLKQRP